MIEFDEQALARFWSKMDRRGPDECWEWRGSFSGKGVASFSLDGKMVTAARLMWEIAGHKPIPEGARLQRMCGNQKCVNPAHLGPPGAHGGRGQNGAVRSGSGQKRRLSLYEMAEMVGARLIPTSAGRYLVRM